jgi:hypothetical protein
VYGSGFRNRAELLELCELCGIGHGSGGLLVHTAVTSFEDQINAYVASGNYEEAGRAATKLGIVLRQEQMKTAPSPQQRLADLELKYAAATNSSRLYALRDLPRAAYAASSFEKAGQYAATLLDSASRNKDKPTFYPEAIFEANTVIGQLAVRRGDLPTATTSLMASIANASSSPRLQYVGPNLGLAQDLLAVGSRDAVLQFLSACKGFWTGDRGNLDLWIAAVRGGGSPLLVNRLNR